MTDPETKPCLRASPDIPCATLFQAEQEQRRLKTALDEARDCRDEAEDRVIDLTKDLNEAHYDCQKALLEGTIARQERDDARLVARELLARYAAESLYRQGERLDWWRANYSWLDEDGANKETHR